MMQRTLLSASRVQRASQSMLQTTMATRSLSSDSQTGHKDVTTNIKADHNSAIVWSDALLSRSERSDYLQASASSTARTKGSTLWITGLSGSGKSTVGAALELKLLQMGVHAYRLDGDNVRFKLNKDLGFTAEDREENLRRIGEVSSLFADSGVIAITSFISPYKSSRDAAREIHERDGVPFFEVFAEVPLEVAEARDPKGLYKKARAGEIKNFTGISDPYEAPENPDLVLRTDKLSVEESCDATIKFLIEKGIISV